MSLSPLKTETITIWCPLNEAELTMVSELAAVGFSADKIAAVLERQKRLFLRDFRTDGTPISDAYKRGLFLAQSETDKATLENAKKGNLTAKQQMEKSGKSKGLKI